MPGLPAAVGPGVKLKHRSGLTLQAHTFLLDPQSPFTSCFAWGLEACQDLCAGSGNRLTLPLLLAPPNLGNTLGTHEEERRPGLPCREEE